MRSIHEGVNMAFTQAINAMRSKVDYPQAILDFADNANLHKLMQVAYG